MHKKTGFLHPWGGDISPRPSAMLEWRYSSWVLLIDVDKLARIPTAAKIIMGLGEVPGLGEGDLMTAGLLDGISRQL